MTKSQLVLSLARINKCAKMIKSATEYCQLHYLDAIEPPLMDICFHKDDILKSTFSNMNDSLAKQIGSMPDNRDIKLFVANTPNLSSDMKVLITNLAECLKELSNIEQAYSRVILDDEYKGLVWGLDKEEALQAFKRAVKEGFLRKDYTPNNLSYAQMKALAFAISTVANIKVRNRPYWTLFERQWNCTAFRSHRMPLVRRDEVAIIEVKFPEVDFAPLYTTNIARQHFKLNSATEDIQKIFNALVIRGYIDPRSKYTDFMKMFGIGDKDKISPINWLTELKELCVFLHCMFYDSNRNICAIASTYFQHMGKELNSSSLKSRMHLVQKNDVDKPYYQKLKSICKQSSPPI